VPCPGSGWLTYVDSNHQVHTMTCFGGTVQNCSNAQDMHFTYGYLNPSGIISGPVKGVIVYFEGADGTVPAGEDTELDMLGYYFQKGYEIVQIAWSSAWEATYNPFPQGTYGNIQNAACRPATFLNYVYSNIFQGVFQNNSSAGMCAQGFSAGSAQIAYSMAYYGSGNFLDNVELISGPVLSDIKQGCQEPQANPVTVCPLDSHGNPQYGCNLGTGGSPWTLSPTYVAKQGSNVGSWTNDNTCAVPGSQQTGQTRWLNQSIVDQSTGQIGQGAVPTFNYLSTAMGAWLCRSVRNQLPDCTGTNYQYDFCPNNSSPEGEIFYAQITSSNSPPNYNLYAVDSCFGPEGAPQGTVLALGSESGQTAIEQDMAGGPVVTAQCFHRTH
jgi:hypothetical protein